MTITNVIIVGGGPAGIGVASLLKQADISYLVLEKNKIGQSFLNWPTTMEMITPSFPSNAFGQIDLNSICIETSPAFSFNKEHLSGKEYSEYLHMVTDYFNLNIQTNTEVKTVHNHKGIWMVETNEGQYFARYLIWAAGEYQNPIIKDIKGAKHCTHSSLIKNPSKLRGEKFVVVGGYESGIQLTYDLIKSNKKVTLINPNPIDDKYTSDPSKVLSPYTFNKYTEIKNSPNYTEVLGELESVTKNQTTYQLQLKDNSIIESTRAPICATGFSLVKGPIDEYISYREDGSPQLVEQTDEFYGQENIYLVGPSVRHDNHLFCFIYKFRQRFGVIVSDIMRKENYIDQEIDMLVNKSKENGMYLSDLSCCDTECVC